MDFSKYSKVSQQVLDEHLAHLDYLQTRIKYLYQQIEQIAESEIYGLAVKKLRLITIFLLTKPRFIAVLVNLVYDLSLTLSNRYRLTKHSENGILICKFNLIKKTCKKGYTS